ncbi:MOSC domain-containing protein [Antarcticirhabdus aurantiaca]|uniref:Molybdenum cofactor sulfurase n=1 Tax=Antarcticirhabdus aurantiaca TaxID=2606717 RepID=A0ACD4NIA8_9HYPH|nr:MOSC domain-containing protein [Antarcticirhabdus aurantiaca]WAJ26560.1 molybdenum cofactor sulfurase [Jeongeuplla avenae]
MPATEAPSIRHPARRLSGRVVELLRTPPGARGFETEPVAALDLGFSGIQGDRHGGETRRSGGREPWYPRGTEIRNERQLSLLSVEELADVAQALGLDDLPAAWIGGNLLLSGIARLTWLPPRTRLVFAGGAVLRIDGDNAPCRASGRAIARHVTDRPSLEFDFVKAARHRRGLVAWVEKPGRIEAGEGVEARLPEQWIYASEPSAS